MIIERIESDKTISRNIIPHYSFKSWGMNIPQEQLLIVYGKVYINLKEVTVLNKEGEKISKVYIHFKDIHSKELITSCIKPRSFEITEGNYYVAILGMCHLKEAKGCTYYNLWVNSPVEQSIALVPCLK